MLRGIGHDRTARLRQKNDGPNFPSARHHSYPLCARLWSDERGLEFDGRYSRACGDDGGGSRRFPGSVRTGSAEELSSSGRRSRGCQEWRGAGRQRVWPRRCRNRPADDGGSHADEHRLDQEAVRGCRDHAARRRGQAGSRSGCQCLSRFRHPDAGWRRSGHAPPPHDPSGRVRRPVQEQQPLLRRIAAVSALSLWRRSSLFELRRVAERLYPGARFRRDDIGLRQGPYPLAAGHGVFVLRRSTAARSDSLAGSGLSTRPRITAGPARRVFHGSAALRDRERYGAFHRRRARRPPCFAARDACGHDGPAGRRAAQRDGPVFLRARDRRDPLHHPSRRHERRSERCAVPARIRFRSLCRL